VVATQNEIVAATLCNLNGEKRVAPLPLCYTGEPTAPKWTGMGSTRDGLLEMIHWKLSDVDEQDLESVESGMSPIDVIKSVKSKQLEPVTPGRPSKRASGN
jgi:hypothetical protein